MSVREKCECGCGGLPPLATKTRTAQGVVKGQPLRFIPGHQNRVNGRGRRRHGPDWVEEDRGYTTPCWIWQHGHAAGGYGAERVDGRSTLAHRVAYEREVGPIPEGLEIDHLCRVRECVNPAHLEAVTKAVNILRGEGTGARYSRRTHCAKGHELTGANVYLIPSGRRKGARRCRACRREEAQAQVVSR